MVYSHLSEHVFCIQGCCCNGNILSVVSIHVHILCCLDEVRRSVRNIRSQLYPDNPYLWPNGTIGYIYSSSLCKSTNTVVIHIVYRECLIRHILIFFFLVHHHRRQLNKSFQYIHKRLCVRFIPYKSSMEYFVIFKLSQTK